ncbi:MAG: tetratricopeptide repeat protein [Candidatus Omnitrophota bacterium]
MKKDLSLKQKVFLIFFGVIVALILIESVLRIGGYFFSLIQSYNNLSRMNEREDIVRILCIGESTTALGGADSYPAQLEKILNSGGDLRFKVINAGLVSKTSHHLLHFLPQYIERYQPHLIVSMIGINDRPDDNFSKGSRFLNSFRTAHLFRLLIQHMKARHADGPGTDTAPVNAESVYRKDKYQQAQNMLDKAEVIHQRFLYILSKDISDKKREEIEDLNQKLLRQMSWILVEMGRESRLREHYSQAVALLQQAINHDASNYGAYVELGRCFKEQGQCPKAVYFLQKAVENNSKTVLADMEMAECFDEMGMYEEAAALYKKILNSDYGDTSQLDSDIAKWFIKHGFDEEAKKALEIALSENPEDYDLNKAAVDFYSKRGESDKSEYYMEKTASLAQKISAYLPQTVYNYNEIVRIAANYNIPVICMQYPLRSIDTLKKIFWLHQPAVFVENKVNFESALEEMNYFMLFSDSFAGDFGHCTRKGNELIAENLAQEILDLLASVSIRKSGRPKDT